MRFLFSALLLATVAATVSAQNCATLTVTGSGAPGTDVVFALSGDATSPAFLAIGNTTGTTVFNFGPLGSLTLDLDHPFAIVPLGFTNASGEAGRTVHIPPNFPSADLFAQGVTISWTPPPHLTLSFCTSNVVAFHIGA